MLRTEELVTSLKLKIHTGEIQPGGRLASERELAQNFGVTRRTLRKALKLLEHEGYLRVRPGGGGGWYVSDLSTPVERWATLARSNAETVAQVLDFRLGVELAAVALAALRRTQVDLLLLREALLRTERLSLEVLQARETNRGGATMDAPDGFHEAIGRAAHNAYLEEALLEARAAQFLAMRRVIPYEEISLSLSGHRAIFEAIEKSDPAGAVLLTIEHVEQLRGLILSSLE